MIGPVDGVALFSVCYAPSRSDRRPASPAMRAGGFHAHEEHPMRETMKLDVASLAVESFVPAPIPPTPENVLTCLNTNCGNKLCCA